MPYKFTLFLVASIVAGYLLTSEAADQDGILLHQLIATQEALKSEKTLLKKEFFLQHGEHVKQQATLNALYIEVNALNKELLSTQLQQEALINNLHFVNGLMGLLFTLQILGLWLLRKGGVIPPKDQSAKCNAVDSPISQISNPALPIEIQTQQSKYIPPAPNATQNIKQDSNSAPNNEVFISNIKIEKAIPLFVAENDSKVSAPLQPSIGNANEEDFAFLEVADVIKTQYLQRLNRPWASAPNTCPPIISNAVKEKIRSLSKKVFLS